MKVVPELTEEDARLYGILLGDGHLSKEGMQWGVSGNPQSDEHLEFVREYLRDGASIFGKRDEAIPISKSIGLRDEGPCKTRRQAVLYRQERLHFPLNTTICMTNQNANGSPLGSPICPSHKLLPCSKDYWKQMAMYPEAKKSPLAIPRYSLLKGFATSSSLRHPHSRKPPREKKRPYAIRPMDRWPSSRERRFPMISGSPLSGNSQKKSAANPSINTTGS